MLPDYLWGNMFFYQQFSNVVFSCIYQNLVCYLELELRRLVEIEIILTFQEHQELLDNTGLI